MSCEPISQHASRCRVRDDLPRRITVVAEQVVHLLIQAIVFDGVTWHFLLAILCGSCLVAHNFIGQYWIEARVRHAGQRELWTRN